MELQRRCSLQQKVAEQRCRAEAAQEGMRSNCASRSRARATVVRTGVVAIDGKEAW